MHWGSSLSTCTIRRCVERPRSQSVSCCTNWSFLSSPAFPLACFFLPSHGPQRKFFWLFSCQRPDRSAGWDLFDVVVIRLLSFLHHHLRCRRRGHLIERLEKNAGGCVLLARGPRRGVELCLSPASHLLLDKVLNMDRHLTKLHLVPTRNGPLYSAVQPLNSARSAHSGNHPGPGVPPGPALSIT